MQMIYLVLHRFYNSLFNSTVFVYIRCPTFGGIFILSEETQPSNLTDDYCDLKLHCPSKIKVANHTLDISVEKKQVTLQQRSQHSQQNYHENLGLRKTLHPPKSTRLKLP